MSGGGLWLAVRPAWKKKRRFELSPPLLKIQMRSRKAEAHGVCSSYGPQQASATMNENGGTSESKVFTKVIQLASRQPDHHVL
jgi:hypothetical protein